jgi:two-component system, cell cycle sensor histidine kinase and response regulator CckA
MPPESHLQAAQPEVGGGESLHPITPKEALELFETMADGVVYQSADGRIIRANPAAERLLGVTMDELLSRDSSDPRWQAIREDGSPFPSEAHPSMIALRTGREVRNVIMGIYHPREESRRWLKVSAVPRFRPGEETPYQAYTTFSDVTEQLRITALLRTYMEKAPDGLLVMDASGRHIEVNAAACRITGYDRADLLRMNYLEHVAPEALPLAREYVARVTREGYAEIDIPCLRKDGSRCIWSVASVKLTDDRFVAFVKDVTTRVEAEQATAAAAALLRRVIDASPGFIAIKDREGHILMGNQALAEMYDTTLEGLEGIREIEFATTPQTLAAIETFLADDREVIESGAAKFIPLERLTLKDGTIRWLQTTKTPITLADGRPGVLVTSADVTEMKRTQEELAASEQRYRLLAENVTDVIWTTDLKGCLTYVSPSVEQISGFSVEELLQRPVDALVSYPSAAAASTEIVRILGATAESQDSIEPVRAEFEMQRKDGSMAQAEVMASAMFSEGRLVGMIGVARDISKRKRQEQALAESEARTRAIFEAAPIGIGVARDRVLLNVNRHLCQMLGYPRDELEGQNARILYPTQDEYEAVGRNHYSELAIHGAGATETHWQTKDGRILNILLSSARIQRESEDTTIVFSGIDITESRQMERAAQQQDRLAAVGQLAAGIAHDFNNLLTSMIGYAELLQLRPELTDEPALEHIIEQGERAAQLTQQILDFGRQSARNPKPLDLGAFLEKALQFVERTVPENIRLGLEVSGSGHVVNADATQLQQVLTNLALNARDAMPAGGRLSFRLHGSETETPDASKKPYVMLEVSDTGAGITPDVMQHIFEPFFTTKPPGKGTGLGLAQVYGIIKQHDGEITVNSQVGQGTTFTIALPTALRAAPDVEQRSVNKLPQGTGETILLVEDDLSVRQVTRTILERLNYQVLTADDGIEALDLYRQHQRDIRLVISDAVMPNMNGLELVHALRTESPDVRVLMISGYRQSADWDDAARQSLVGWLTKPPNLSELAAILRETLAE